MTPEDQANALLKAADQKRWLRIRNHVMHIVENDCDHVQPATCEFAECFECGKISDRIANKVEEELCSALLEKHKALEEARELFRSMCSAYKNQDLSHVDFRVKCAEFAQDFLARHGG